MNNAMTYDKEQLEQISQQINKTKDAISASLSIITKALQELFNNDNFDPQTKAELNDIITTIKGADTKYGESLAGIANFLVELVQIFVANESKITNELKDWVSTFKTSIDTLKGGYTATGVEKGSYSASSYASDMLNSALTISQNTKSSVKELINMGANTGKAFKSVTGYSAQDFVNKGAGTIKTLFGNANLENSIIGRFVNAGSDIMSGLLNLA